MFRILIKLSNQAPSSLSSKPSNQIRNQFMSEEESEQSQSPKIPQKSQQYFRTSRKIIFPSLRIRSMRIIKKLNQKKSCFKVSFFRSGVKGIFRDIQQIRSEKQSQKGSSKSVLKVMMPVPLSHLSQEERRSIIESRWVIGPRPGSELKGRFCAKGLKQVISRRTSMLQPLKPRPSSSFFSWVRFILGKSRFQILPQHFSTPLWIPQNHRSLFRHLENFPIQSQWSGVSSVNYMVSEMLLKHAKQQAHFPQIMVSKGMVQMKSDSRSSRKINWVMFDLRS